MRTVGKFIEPIVLFFIIIILFQSCVVYEKSSVSLEWAAKQERKVKVETINNQNYKFNFIRFENDKFYGIKKVNGEIIKTPLEDDKLNKIHLQNKSTSTIATITTVLGSLILVPVVIFILGGGLDF
jgi:hypothetical protein